MSEATPIHSVLGRAEARDSPAPADSPRRGDLYPTGLPPSDHEYHGVILGTL